MKDISNLHPKKILVCQLRQIGDVLLATPSIQLLKERFPQAEIHLLTEKKCLPVVENNPHLSHVWAIDKKALKNPLAAFKWYAQVGRSGYDLIVDFQRLPRCRYVLMFSNAEVKLTQETAWYNRFLYTHFSDVIYGYAAMLKASIMRPLGIHWDGQLPKIYLTDEEKQWADAFIKAQGMEPHRFVTIDPSHRRITRKWPERHFAGLIKLLREKHPVLKFFILYGPGELEVAQKVAEIAGDGAIVSREMLTLRQMAAVQAKAALHVGNCSAPRHFAVAVDTPSLSIHGATGFGWCPKTEKHSSVDKGLPCRSCNKNTCETIECLETFLPEECLDEALRLLAFKME
ncbi:MULTISPECIES: glycosyltransferase family 9 protein [unclassified Pseudodesulfovibrio]|uniref:glycosyltransferase family 9 protein n=1 Tax=unclassified Pseudodesulfovibrio TaxID=2661612 RepID=UPI000FEB7FCB|nr:MULTISPECIES: glycosyltransferase family 9 protein [unclassified Pseudodesulfovibrio]MCJ2164149.1 glycosyltransferase family 9 protein [Pseudodesulfovibrio sp. S3-i]RWU05222.1 glycosyltransferase family 9 protein [Pseudodesulfovibrio sp. S3]